VFVIYDRVRLPCRPHRYTEKHTVLLETALQACYQAMLSLEWHP
jgi:hypothetical protein